MQPGLYFLLLNYLHLNKNPIIQFL